MANWTVDDALRMTARMADWLETGDAQRLAVQHVWAFVDVEEADNVNELARESNLALATAIRAQDPIWCDPHMVDLLAVATAELPGGGVVQPWDLPTPEAGIVFFAKPLPTDWHGVRSLEKGSLLDYHDEIDAITWERPYTNCWIVRPWSRGRGIGIYKVTGAGRVRCPDLRPSAVVEVIGDQTELTPVSQILVALTALARSSATVGETSERASKVARLRAKRAKMADPRVRRLYLLKPETGSAELQALRDHRNGTPRGHWVRGHWRRQWYASVEEHRWQWVDGFPRGDFAKGTVTGLRIQVARGDAAPRVPD